MFHLVENLRIFLKVLPLLISRILVTLLLSKEYFQKIGSFYLHMSWLHKNGILNIINISHYRCRKTTIRSRILRNTTRRYEFKNHISFRDHLLFEFLIPVTTILFVLKGSQYVPNPSPNKLPMALQALF